MLWRLSHFACTSLRVTPRVKRRRSFGEGMIFGEPVLIQGGMGAGVSNWRLAQAVSSLGHLGVVSGTALDTLLIRRLQIGDPAGDIRRAMEQFPLKEFVKNTLQKYFVDQGKGLAKAFAL